MGVYVASSILASAQHDNPDMLTCNRNNLTDKLTLLRLIRRRRLRVLRRERLQRARREEHAALERAELGVRLGLLDDLLLVRLADAEAVAVHGRVLEVQLLVELEAEVVRDARVLRVEAVADALQRARELGEVRVVLGLHDEVVVLELVEVERVLHHVRVLGQRHVEVLRGR